MKFFGDFQGLSAFKSLANFAMTGPTRNNLLHLFKLDIFGKIENQWNLP